MADKDNLTSKPAGGGGGGGPHANRPNETPTGDPGAVRLTGGAAAAGPDVPTTPDGLRPEERSKAALAASEGVEAKRKADEAKLAKETAEPLIVVRDGFYGPDGQLCPMGTELDPKEEWVQRAVLPYIHEANPIAKPKSLAEAEARADELRAKAAKDAEEARPKDKG